MEMRHRGIEVSNYWFNYFNMSTIIDQSPNYDNENQSFVREPFTKYFKYDVPEFVGLLHNISE